ncbi:ABC transporter ATP-binding protein [Microcoleus sp. FACHB-1515]|uniref:ABC transporter ATP-binding protein n=1 Tax=Cyanophyceae TaxID=3028117 RepID=UPI001684BB85|nr:ABC transporter ATP-binding protein [Microcoleus sp. FACHB-1515]MBD2091508.1 ABC transporter ATP-binding protein [Microcoleus sp. FACHB-1515]
MSHCLEAENLTLGYDRGSIVAHLNLTIPTGQITVLVGPNGCGKSTLLRGLARLLKPRRGRIALDGADIFKLSTRSVAKRLAMLPQNPIAPEGLTVRDLVAQGRYPYQTWWQQWSELDEKRVEEAIAKTDLMTFAAHPLDQLSGGQRQRAWIAMTLAQDTEILLLDEPTTFLDLAHQMEVLDLLHDLNQQEGRTIVMVLHDLNQACRYADYLVAMRQGTIYAQGKPSEVMTPELVRDVFEVDCQIVRDPVKGTPMCVPIARSNSSL